MRASKTAATALVLLGLLVASSSGGTCGTWLEQGNGNFRQYRADVLPVGGLAPRWSTPLSGKSYCPVVVDETTLYVGSDAGAFVALSRADGSVRWRFRPLARIRASACVGENTVYMAAYDGNLYALDRDSGWLRWQLSTASWIEAAPAVHSRHVIVACYAGLVYAVDRSTGAEVWRRSVGAEFIVRSPAVADRAVIIATASGLVVAMNPASGNVIWQRRLPEVAVFGPSICGDRVLIAGASQDGGSLTALDLATGEVLWRTDTGRILGAAVAGDRVVIAGDEAVETYAVDTGQTLKRYELCNARPSGQLVVTDALALLAVVSDQGPGLVWLDLEDGTTEFVRLPAVPTTELAVADDDVFMGAADGRVYALSRLRVFVGERELAFADVWPAMVGGTVLAPLRPILEAIGAEVLWDHAERLLTVKLGSRQVQLDVGSLAGFSLIEGRLVGPVRFVAEIVGARVDWYPELVRVVLWPPPPEPVKDVLEA